MTEKTTKTDEPTLDPALAEFISAQPLHVEGELLHQMRVLVEGYQRPLIMPIADPVTKTPALIAVGHEGVSVIPHSVFDGYLERPRHRTGTATLLTLDSLIDHANRFKDQGSIIFADNNRSAPSMTAVLDYHPEGPADDTLPRFGKHRGHYTFPLSEEWKAWKAADGKVMKMAEFAEFLEERIVDVIGLIPDEDQVSEELQKFINACGGTETIADPARLIQLSRGLQVYESAVVKQANKLSSGEGELIFEVQHNGQDGKPLKVPSLFLIVIPIFDAGAPYRIAARLRYRKSGEGIVFWYDLWRPERSFDAAIAEACDKAQTLTELPLLLGKPE